MGLKYLELMWELKDAESWCTILTVASDHLLNCVLDTLAAKCSTNTHLQSEKHNTHIKYMYIYICVYIYYMCVYVYTHK